MTKVSKTPRDTMRLPEGWTCADCRFFYYCSEFIGPEITGNTTCDWAPSRFQINPALVVRKAELQQ
jgi:hypothetical protein